MYASLWALIVEYDFYLVPQKLVSCVMSDLGCIIVIKLIKCLSRIFRAVVESYFQDISWKGVTWSKEVHIIFCSGSESQGGYTHYFSLMETALPVLVCTIRLPFYF